MPETVGDLDGDREVLRFSFSEVAHLPAAEGVCPVFERNTCKRDPDRKRAAVLFADTPICRDCREVVKRRTGDATLPTDTEVVGDD
jgi:hypothetical protein